MCRNVDHGGRRCPSSKLEGAKLAEHNRRKRLANARKKAIVQWANDNGLASEIEGMTPGQTTAWAQQNGVMKDELVLTDEARATLELSDKEQWLLDFENAATGEDVRKLLEADGLTPETRTQLEQYAQILEGDGLLAIAMEGDGEDHLQDVAEDDGGKPSLFARFDGWLKNSWSGQVFDNIVGISDFMMIVHPLGAPIRVVKKFKSLKDEHLRKVEADLADGRLFDVELPLVTQTDEDDALAQIRMEILAREGVKAASLPNGDVVFPPDSKLKIVNKGWEDGTLVVQAEVFNPPGKKIITGEPVVWSKLKDLQPTPNEEDKQLFDSIVEDNLSGINRAIKNNPAAPEEKAQADVIKRLLRDTQPLEEDTVVYMERDILPGLDLNKLDRFDSNNPLFLNSPDLMLASGDSTILTGAADKIQIELSVPKGRKMLSPAAWGSKIKNNDDLLVAAEEGLLAIISAERGEDGIVRAKAKLLSSDIQLTLDEEKEE